jgi:alpha-beta hydrolase superfamily lysophospholipase/SAM-dependent methyltransferase
MAHIVEELNLPEVAFFALDARAHGRSEGKQDSGVTMATFVQDLDEFVRHIEAAFGFQTANVAVIAQSIGAVIAAAWAHDYAPPVRAMVLAAPAFRVKLYVPFARLGLAIWHAIVGDFFVQSYVKGSALTHDRERAASYATDPLIKRPISVRVLLSLDQMAQRVVDDAAAIRVPVQLLLSGSDWVVRNGPQQQFFERLGSSVKEIHTFEGFFHDTLGEKDRRLPIAKARTFLQMLFATPAHNESLLDADRKGFTKSEYDALSTPLPWWSPKNLSFAGTRLFMRTLGRVSDGMRLGVDCGFDSGASLDYVYRNQPGGFTPIGKLIDWIYLSAVGWRGVRVRKLLLEELLGLAMTKQRAAGTPVRILDVAAGHGRYVLEGIQKSGVAAESILLRDFDPGNVASGKELVKGLDATFEQADAFDRASYRGVQATIGIVSGLFELFPDNDRPRRALGGIADAIAPGGYLLYTGQPWHPQIEMIARTLTSHLGGKPWVMRRRTQEELDQLVAEAGFRKVAQRIDPMGLFTVSLAQRVK